MPYDDIGMVISIYQGTQYYLQWGVVLCGLWSSSRTLQRADLAVDRLLAPRSNLARGAVGASLQA